MTNTPREARRLATTPRQVLLVLGALISGVALVFSPLRAADEAEPAEGGADSPAIGAQRHAGQQPAIRVGEDLEFQVKWGVVPAGTATMRVVSKETFEDHPCYRVVATATSNQVFDKVYPVRDHFESFMDADDLKSWAFKKHLREGTFRRDQIVRKDHAAGKAYYHDGQVCDMTPNSHDVLSAFYYVRTLPLTEGNEFYLSSHTDRKNYPIKVNVLGRERVEVPAGTFDCIVVEPTLRSGDFIKNEGSLKIWLTDDERRIPVQMKSKIPVGSIAVVLEKYVRP
ncbi:MAG: DUF3108 domain-containing protein [Candidatus Eisenbacteria bacterium]|uniref:DUF3108 domain-containing protein n=1 Tax=Eiseniibacteriota bacterium TaxID=2212470 RepID=A0A956RNU5_UNCEI|nr:DUF3108 domain-containing protein [Candidatus Eisenbacteria bacterium]